MRFKRILRGIFVSEFWNFEAHFCEPLNASGCLVLYMSQSSEKKEQQISFLNFTQKARSENGWIVENLMVFHADRQRYSLFIPELFHANILFCNKQNSLRLNSFIWQSL
jgi:hypothetical protein